jgi:hypothetical protein
MSFAHLTELKHPVHPCEVFAVMFAGPSQTLDSGVLDSLG